jgi:glycolate oxidase iron-sulfur subunit
VDLRIDDDDLAACVSCGLCLPHCPTYRVTGEESASPRGRIAAMRAVQWDGLDPDDEFTGFMDACVQCRGCETACPSDVPFGSLMATTRATLASTRPRTVPRHRRAGYFLLGRPAAVRAGSLVLAVGQRLGLVPRRLGLPRIPLRQTPLESSGHDVWLFTGCVMDAWQRHVHRATMRVIEATGAGVMVPDTGAGAGCCGALQEHAGLAGQAYHMAYRTVGAFPGSAPILVNSAGCGAMLKSYGEVLGTRQGERFAARVFDVHEWLADRIDELPPARRPPTGTVAVQDACHLRHVQRAHTPVRTVLGRYADLVELDNEGLCCGAGGAYSALHPELAGPIRDRLVASVARSGAPVVASANPGCAMHLTAAGLRVRHPMELVAEALDLL